MTTWNYTTLTTFTLVYTWPLTSQYLFLSFTNIALNSTHSYIYIYIYIWHYLDLVESITKTALYSHSWRSLHTFDSGWSRPGAALVTQHDQLMSGSWWYKIFFWHAIYKNGKITSSQKIGSAVYSYRAV